MNQKDQNNSNSNAIAVLLNLVQAVNNLNQTMAAAFPAPLTGSAVWDPASVADGDQVTTTVTVSGASLGQYADGNFSISLAGMQLSAYVSAANTVTVLLQNNSGGAIDLGSGTLKVRVWQ